ncbi:hypothetical protein EDC04DRAFT_3092959 [Pisolithus marmoratus]|nr:hypothetical protein EDC04DRAFT_3092959 [Pisolithus marmoratus]
MARLALLALWCMGYSYVVTTVTTWGRYASEALVITDLLGTEKGIEALIKFLNEMEAFKKWNRANPITPTCGHSHHQNNPFSISYIFTTVITTLNMIQATVTHFISHNLASMDGLWMEEEASTDHESLTHYPLHLLIFLLLFMWKVEDDLGLDKDHYVGSDAKCHFQVGLVQVLKVNLSGSTECWHTKDMIAMLLGARQCATIQKAAANEYEPITQVVSLMEHSEDLDPDGISQCFTSNCSAKTLHLSPKMLCQLPRKEELVKEGIPVAVRFGEYSHYHCVRFHRLVINTFQSRFLIHTIFFCNNDGFTHCQLIKGDTAWPSNGLIQEDVGEQVYVTEEGAEVISDEIS